MAVPEPGPPRLETPEKQQLQAPHLSHLSCLRYKPFHDEPPVFTQLREKAAKETVMPCVLVTYNCNYLKSFYISLLCISHVPT